MRAKEVVVLMGLEPSSCLTVDSRDIIRGPTSNSFTSRLASGMGLSDVPL